MADTATPTNRQEITNPYDAEHRAEYKMGGIEEFLHDTLGFRTGIDTYNENMDNASAAWLAQQQNNAYEETYNSPEAQAARMREAGLNPDIAPNTITPGEATEFTEPESAPESPMGEDMETIQKAGEMVANLGFRLLDSLVGGYASITRTGIEKAMAESRLDIEEDEAIGKMVDEALLTYGNPEESAELQYVNGGYIARQKGLRGKRYEKFARRYDDTYATIKSLNARIKAGTEFEKTKNEAEIVEIINKVNKANAENQLKVEQIVAEKNKRIAEYLQKHPEWNEEELRARKGKAELTEAENNAVISGYNKIERQYEKEIAEMYSKVIKDYEEVIEIENGQWKGHKVYKSHNYDEYMQYRRAKAYMNKSSRDAGIGVNVMGTGFNAN